MGIAKSRYFNDPSIGQAAATLSSWFAPPMGMESGSDASGYAAADAKRAEMNRLGRYFDMSMDPNVSLDMLSRVGTGAGVLNFTNNKYGVDQGNINALEQRRMMEQGLMDRQLISPVTVGKDQQVYVSPKQAEIMDIPTMLQGKDSPLTAEQLAAQERNRLIEAGVITDDMLVEDFLGQRTPVQGVGPDGKTGQFMSPGAAVRSGAQPLPKDSAPGMSVTLPDGTTMAMGGKALTEAQSKDSVYFTRASGAIPNLDKYGDSLREIQGNVGTATEKFGGNFLKSTEYQLGEQAGREFLQAILRKDTGAAITKEEEAAYGQTYLPRPGDSPELLEQKKASRARAIAAIRLGLPPDAILNAERAGVDLSVSALPTAQNAAPAPAAPPAAPNASTPTVTEGTIIEDDNGTRLILRNGNWEPYNG